MNRQPYLTFAYSSNTCSFTFHYSLVLHPAWSSDSVEVMVCYPCPFLYFNFFNSKGESSRAKKGRSSDSLEVILCYSCSFLSLRFFFSPQTRLNEKKKKMKRKKKSPTCFPYPTQGHSDPSLLTLH